MLKLKEIILNKMVRIDSNYADNIVGHVREFVTDDHVMLQICNPYYAVCSAYYIIVELKNLAPTKPYFMRRVRKSIFDTDSRLFTVEIAKKYYGGTIIKGNRWPNGRKLSSSQKSAICGWDVPKDIISHDLPKHFGYIR